MSQNPTKYFKRLDAWRTVAFLGVFLFHSFDTEYDYIKSDSVYKFSQWLTRNGDLGVNFFFVLSGFLITTILLREENKSFIHLGKFYMRRVLRIWPLYFATVIFGFIFFPLLKTWFGAVADETANPVLFVFFLSNYNNIINGLPDASMLGVLWSVSIEEQFYLGFPLLLLLTRRFRIAGLVTIIITGIVFRYIYYEDQSMVYFHTLNAAHDLSLGCLLGLLTTRGWRVRPGKLVAVIIYGIGLLVILFKQEIFTGIIGFSIEKTFLALFFVFIIYDQSFNPKSVNRIGESAILQALGKYTYGLYCLHFIGILAAVTISKSVGIDKFVIGVVGFETILGMIFSVICAVISYRIIEKPFLNLKKNF